MKNEDVVGAAPTGDAPTTSELSKIQLPTRMPLILETWLYVYKFAILSRAINSLWTKNTIRWHRSVSTLVQVKAYCMTVPRHYLNTYWLLIGGVLWHSPESNFTLSTKNVVLYNDFEIYALKITPQSSRANELKCSWEGMLMSLKIMCT